MPTSFPESEAPAPTAEGARVRFAVISDPHITSAPRPAVRAVVRAILGLARRPAFLVDTGDSTELGWTEEIARYRSEVVAPLRAAGIELLAVPGNHDARWSPTDTLEHQRATQRQSVLAHHEGLALALLASGLPGEQHGHLEPADMREVLLERARTEPWVPTFAFCHHPLLEGDPYMTGCVAAHEMLRHLRVSALFVGHGHGWDRWCINGIHQLMTGAAMSGAFRIVDVERDHLATWGVQVAWDESEGDVANLRLNEIEGTRLTLPLRPQPVPRLALSAPGLPRDGVQELTLSTDAALTAELRLRGAASLEVELAEGGGEVTATLPLAGAAGGMPTFFLRCEHPEHGLLLTSLRGRVETESACLEWAVPMDGSVFAAPLLADGRIYCATRGGSVYALQLVDRAFLWSYRADGPIQSAPACDGSRLFFGSSDRSIHAVRLDNGSRVWRFPTGGPVRSSPVVWQERVYVGGGDGIVRCLDARTGALRWEHTVGRLVECRPAVGEGRVVFGAWDQKLHCLHATSGRELWAAPYGRNVYYSPATASPLILGERVYASAPDNTVRCFAIETGEELWQAELQAGYTSPCLTPDGTPVWGTMNGELVGLDPETGADRFRVDLGAGTFNAGPSCAGERITVGSLHGMLYLASASTGAKLAEADLGETLVFATPAFDGERAVAGTMDGWLACVRIMGTEPVFAE